MVVKDALNVNIGGNPAAEGGEEDEGVDDQVRNQQTDYFLISATLSLARFWNKNQCLVFHF